jgi:hypothetical protein
LWCVWTVGVATGTGKLLEALSSLEGSFLGFLDFDGKRYWDIKASSVRSEVRLKEQHLPSDSRLRADRNALAAGDEPTAQQEKVKIEERQRRERRLRAAAMKAREGGCLASWDAAAVK